MTKPNRVAWPSGIVNTVMTQSHHRCCVCLEHRRAANIHHIDENPSNSIEENAIALCLECHADVHTQSTMRRKITAEQLRLYKKNWIDKCNSIELFLRSNINTFSSIYYLNVHRLDEIWRSTYKQSLMLGVPHRPPSQMGSYDSLWPNPKNSLGRMDLAENRGYFEAAMREMLPSLPLIDINLIELGAIDPTEKIGCLVGFSCQFIGKDIPDQDELVESLGIITGPTPTMRREILDEGNDSVVEICLSIDPAYMYADSAFIHFSEHGTWNGFGRILNVRKGVGSNDGHLLRTQIFVSPVCIGTPPSHGHTSQIPAIEQRVDESYLALLDII